jgi:hypothetical protein
LLGKVHPQHAFESDGLTPHFAGLRVVRLEGGEQLCPWHGDINLAQKPFPASNPLNRCVLQIAEAALHGLCLQIGSGHFLRSPGIPGINQRVLCSGGIDWGGSTLGRFFDFTLPIT